MNHIVDNKLFTSINYNFIFNHNSKTSSDPVFINLKRIK